MIHRTWIAIAPLALVALLWCSIPGTASAQETLLRWKLQPGQRFKIEVDQEMKQKISVSGFDQEMPITMFMGMTWEVARVGQEGIELVQTMDRIKMHMDAGVMVIDFDSAEDAGGAGQREFREMFAPMIGAKFEVTMTDRGEIKGVEIPPDALRGFRRDPMLGQVFSEEMFKQLTQSSAMLLPESPISRGHTWSDESTVAMAPLGTMTIKSNYTYDGPETVDGRRLEKISASITTDIDDAGAADAEIRITNQESSGTLYFDNQAGYLTRSTIKQAMTMQMEAGGQQMTMQIDSTMDMKVTRGDSIR